MNINTNFSIPDKLLEMFLEACYLPKEYCEDDEDDYYWDDDDSCLFDDCTELFEYKGYPILLVEIWDEKFIYYLANKTWHQWEYSLFPEDLHQALIDLYSHLDELALSVPSAGQLSLFETA